MSFALFFPLKMADLMADCHFLGKKFACIEILMYFCARFLMYY